MNSNAKYFDCHFHIIDKNFPVVANQGFMPDAFTGEDYLERVKAVDLCGGAVVSGSFQAFDQSYLFHALKVLGPNFVGVTQVPETVSDHELRELDGAGVRAVRFNVKRGGSEDIHHLESRRGALIYWSAGTRSCTSILPSLPIFIRRWCRCRRSASTISVSRGRGFQRCSNLRKKVCG